MCLLATSKYVVGKMFNRRLQNKIFINVYNAYLNMICILFVYRISAK